MSESKINQWTVDFAQAKIALKNLEVLVQTSTNLQAESVAQLKQLFIAYDNFADDGDSNPRKAKLTEQINLLSRVERNLHIHTTKFSSKAKAQLEAARSQVGALYATLGKLRSMKQPQHDEVSAQLGQQIPSFLDLFDAFLARFALQIRLQQADFYKQLGDAFSHVGQPQPVQEIKAKWLAEFEQIMSAVEVMRSITPQVKNATLPGTTASPHDGNSGNRMTFTTEKVDSVLLAPVKWIHSKISRDLKHFQFSDPRMGFFNKPTQPPAHEEEKAEALYDFQGETDSDLSFKKGDIINIVDKGTEDDPHWWCGDLNGRRGLFPRNYVMEKHEPHPDEYIPKPDTSKEPAVNQPLTEKLKDSDASHGPPRELGESESNHVMPSQSTPTLSVPSQSTPSQSDISVSAKEPSKPSEKQELENRLPHSTETVLGESKPSKDSEKPPATPARPKRDAPPEAEAPGPEPNKDSSKPPATPPRPKRDPSSEVKSVATESTNDTPKSPITSSPPKQEPTSETQASKIEPTNEQPFSDGAKASGPVKEMPKSGASEKPINDLAGTEKSSSLKSSKESDIDSPSTEAVSKVNVATSDELL